MTNSTDRLVTDQVTPSPSQIRMAARGTCVAIAAVVVMWPVRVELPLIVPVLGWVLTGLWTWGAVRRLVRSEDGRRAAEARAHHAAPPPMTVRSALRGPTWARIGDAERDAVLTFLAARFESGHINRVELDERQTQALEARVRGDLKLPVTGLLIF